MTITTPIAVAPAQPAGRFAAPPLARLVRIELRKLVDTRSGFWLLVGVALLTVLVVGVDAITAEPSGRTLKDAFGIALVPVSVLLPIVGLLGVAAEFSQRTALQTFTAVPQRERVLAAKGLAVLVLGVAATLACLALAMVANVVTPLLGDADGSWALGSALGQALLFVELGMAFGLALGMLFASPAVAIVVYFVVPTAFTIAADLIPGLAGVRDWLDTAEAWAPLANFVAHGQDWAQMATASALWIGVPLVAGVVLLRRREVS